MAVDDLLKRLFFVQMPQKRATIAPGIYHSMRETDGSYTRFHLRVDRDGSGMLMANATAAIHLSQAGVVIAKGLMDGKHETDILKTLGVGFRGASQEAMQEDVRKVQSLIAWLGAPGDNYPVLSLEDVAFSARQAQLIAPFQADVPLAEPEKIVPILDKLWQVGIPNVCFLVPEQPGANHRQHLIRAIERAEDVGMIAGVRARASDLEQGNVLYDMAMAGVDYVTILYASDRAEIHDALCGAGDWAATERVIHNLLNLEVCPVAEIALVQQTIDRLEQTLGALQAMHVTNTSFFAIAYVVDERPVGELPAGAKAGALAARSLLPLAVQIEELASQGQVRFIWQPTVQYAPDKSLSEQVCAGPRCSGEVAVRIEPDGAVIPARGAYRRAGNVLYDSWETIWGDSAFRIFREHVEPTQQCDSCPGLPMCAITCLREHAGWSYG